MTEDQEIQEEIDELEKQLYNALRALDVKIEKDSDREKLKDASEKLQLLKKRLSGETILFSETYYFVRCGICGYEAGAYYKKPPDENTCGACGKTSKIIHNLARMPSYMHGRQW